MQSFFIFKLQNSLEKIVRFTKAVLQMGKLRQGGDSGWHWVHLASRWHRGGGADLQGQGAGALPVAEEALGVSPRHGIGAELRS